MNAYLINLFIICLIGIISLTIKNKNIRRKFFLYGAFIDLFLFLSLRALTVGIDMPIYLQIYDDCNLYGWNVIYNLRYEVGFITYTKLIANIINSEQIYVCITAFLALIGPFYIIKKYSKNYFLSVFLFITFQFFTYDFYLLRQVIAISIVLLSIKFVEERKLFKFIFMVLLATIFHTTTCLFLIVYWIYKIRVNNRKLLWLTGIAIAIMILGNTVINMVFQYFYKYAYYSQLTNEGGGYFYLFVLICIFVFTTLIRDVYFNSEKTNSLWYNILIFAILVQLFATIQSIFNRVTIYYSISIIIVLPNVIRCLRKSNLRLIVSILIYIFLTFYYVIETQNSIIYMDYSFFWQ